jgi:hypothetical protein
MNKESFGWPLPGVANNDALIQYSQGTAHTPQNAADPDVTAISHQGLTDFYAIIYLLFTSQTDDL